MSYLPFASLGIPYSFDTNWLVGNDMIPVVLQYVNSKESLPYEPGPFLIVQKKREFY